MSSPNSIQTPISTTVHRTNQYILRLGNLCWNNLTEMSVKHSTDEGSFIFYEGVGAGGIYEAPCKTSPEPPSAYQFFHMPPPPSLIAVIFILDETPPPPPTTKKLKILSYLFYYSSTWCYRAHYEDEIYNPYTTESSSVEKKQTHKKKKEKSNAFVLVPSRHVASYTHLCTCLLEVARTFWKFLLAVFPFLSFYLYAPKVSWCQHHVCKSLFKHRKSSVKLKV